MEVESTSSIVPNYPPSKIYKALECATSSSKADREYALTVLQEWSKHSEFYIALQNAFLDHDASINIRMQAVIQFKHGMDRYWRPSAQHAIKAEHREILRTRLVDASVYELDKPVRQTAALALAKVVRISVHSGQPSGVPELIEILRKLQHGNQHQLYGVLSCIREVVLELGSTRLPQALKQLEPLIVDILALVTTIFDSGISAWAGAPAGLASGNDMDLNILNCVVCLQIMEPIFTGSLIRPTQQLVARQCWSATVRHLFNLTTPLSNPEGYGSTLVSSLGRCIYQIARLHQSVASEASYQFFYLEGTASICQHYWLIVQRLAAGFQSSMGLAGHGGDEPQDEDVCNPVKLLELVALKGLLIWIEVARFLLPRAKTIVRTPEDPDNQDLIFHTHQELLDNTVMTQISNDLLTRLLVFRKSDLDAWEDDPQGWDLETHAEDTGWQWDVRLASEKLYVDLLARSKDLLVPQLLQLINQNLYSSTDIIATESLYSALGISAACIFNEFDFNTILTTKVAQDVHRQDVGCKILRRRLAILLHQWVFIGISPDHMLLVYQIFNQLMDPSNPGNDVVVRFAAARRFGYVAENLEPPEGSGPDFEAAFQPVLTSLMQNMANIVMEAEHEDTKVALLLSLRQVVAALSRYARLFAEWLFQTLSTLWGTNEAQDFCVKQAILSILTALVGGLCTDTSRYYSLLLPILRDGLQPGSAMQIHMLDECLELWRAILSFCTPPVDPLVISLADKAVELLCTQMESMDLCLLLVKDYIALAPERILSDHLRSTTLKTLFKSYGLRMKLDLTTTRQSICLMISLAGEIAGPAGIKVVVKDMVDAHVVSDMMKVISHTWAEKHTDQSPVPSSYNVMAEYHYFSILSQIVLADPQYLIEMISSVYSFPDIQGCLLDRWFEINTDQDYGEMAKDGALALTRFLDLPSMQECVLSRLKQYVTMWLRMVDSSYSDDSCPAEHDIYIWKPEDLNPYEFETPLEHHTRCIKARWPVHTIPLLPFIKDQLSRLINQVGGEVAFREKYISQLDPTMIEDFYLLMERK